MDAAPNNSIRYPAKTGEIIAPTAYIKINDALNDAIWLVWVRLLA